MLLLQRSKGLMDFLFLKAHHATVIAFGPIHRTSFQKNIPILNEVSFQRVFHDHFGIGVFGKI